MGARPDAIRPDPARPNSTRARGGGCPGCAAVRGAQAAPGSAQGAGRRSGGPRPESRAQDLTRAGPAGQCRPPRGLPGPSAGGRCPRALSPSAQARLGACRVWLWGDLAEAPNPLPDHARAPGTLSMAGAGLPSWRPALAHTPYTLSAVFAPRLPPPQQTLTQGPGHPWVLGAAWPTQPFWFFLWAETTPLCLGFPVC